MSIFNKIQFKKPRRSNFDLSFDNKLTTDFGKLTPFMCLEVLPGDTFKVSSELFARVAPMVAPIMSRVDVKTYFFFVPNRIIFNKWEDFITGGEDGREVVTLPQCEYRDFADFASCGKGTLCDYLGLCDIDANRNIKPINMLPFFAYQQVWNDWFRDQNVQEEIEIPKNHTGATLSQGEINRMTSLRYVAWEKDYFTSALPWPQRGPEVVLPLKDGKIRIEDAVFGGAEHNAVNDVAMLESSGSGWYELKSAQGDTMFTIAGDSQLSSMAPTIRELRKSVSVQQWLENNARGGARYIEQLLSHFGVKSSDARLQRSELLGGGTAPILISEVLQTSPADVDGQSAVGNMAGHGVSANRTAAFKRHFEEHGILLGLCFVRPKNSYMSGVHRMWLREDKFDFAWPEFARIGEQEIQNVELYTKSASPHSTFGYAPRYSEYKYHASEVHGDFLSSMDSWHLARKYKNQPNLNEQFVSMEGASNDLKRIFAVTDDVNDHFWLQIFNNVKVKRCLPYYGTPSL